MSWRVGEGSSGGCGDEFRGLTDYCWRMNQMLENNNDESCSQGLSACAESLGIARIERHIFICADQTVPKCCDRAASLVAWNYLKKRLQELGLDKPSAARPTCIFRTKAN